MGVWRLHELAYRDQTELEGRTLATYSSNSGISPHGPDTSPDKAGLCHPKCPSSSILCFCVVCPTPPLATTPTSSFPRMSPPSHTIGNKKGSLIGAKKEIPHTILLMVIKANKRRLLYHQIAVHVILPEIRYLLVLKQLPLCHLAHQNFHMDRETSNRKADKFGHLLRRRQINSIECLSNRGVCQLDNGSAG